MITARDKPGDSTLPVTARLREIKHFDSQRFGPKSHQNNSPILTLPQTLKPNRVPHDDTPFYSRNHQE
jgi:hypothetical protein